MKIHQMKTLTLKKMISMRMNQIHNNKTLKKAHHHKTMKTNNKIMITMMMTAISMILKERGNKEQRKELWPKCQQEGKRSLK